MSTRTARTKLDTKIRYQKEVIAGLQEALSVAHKGWEVTKEKLIKAEQDVMWQKKRVAKRDRKIEESIV